MSIEGQAEWSYDLLIVAIHQQIFPPITTIMTYLDSASLPPRVIIRGTVNSVEFVLRADTTFCNHQQFQFQFQNPLSTQKSNHKVRYGTLHTLCALSNCLKAIVLSKTVSGASPQSTIFNPCLKGFCPVYTDHEKSGAILLDPWRIPKGPNRAPGRAVTPCEKENCWPLGRKK